MRRIPIIAALSLLPVMLSAQGGRAPTNTPARSEAACGVSATAPWAQRQAQWFDESKHDWTNDTLRTALLQAAGLAVPLATPVQLGVHVEGRDPALGVLATDMIQRLNTVAATRGSTWPTKSVVGAAGTHAVYLLALRDTGFARAALHRMMEAGTDESVAADVATLEDQLRLVWGKKQLYGTQFHAGVDGKLVLSPMEDSAHADMRREDAGLPPFKVGLCLAKNAK